MADDRNEARFLASVEAGTGWFGVSKVIVTLLSGQGRDAVLTHVPPAAADRLRLAGPDLVVIADSGAS
jgi:hypothetical protein